MNCTAPSIKKSLFNWLFYFGRYSHTQNFVVVSFKWDQNNYVVLSNFVEMDHIMTLLGTAFSALQVYNLFEWRIYIEQVWVTGWSKFHHFGKECLQANAMPREGVTHSLLKVVSKLFPKCSWQFMRKRQFSRWYCIDLIVQDRKPQLTILSGLLADC